MPLVTAIDRNSLSATIQPIPYTSSGPSVKSMSLQFRDKDVVWDSIKCFAQVQTDDFHSFISKRCFFVKVPLDMVTDKRVSELSKLPSQREEEKPDLSWSVDQSLKNTEQSSLQLQGHRLCGITACAAYRDAVAIALPVRNRPPREGRIHYHLFWRSDSRSDISTDELGNSDFVYTLKQLKPPICPKEVQSDPYVRKGKIWDERQYTENPLQMDSDENPGPGHWNAGLFALNGIIKQMSVSCSKGIFNWVKKGITRTKVWN
ncbi:hypothetical protein QYF61_008634, partial [Mycteria americana]